MSGTVWIAPSWRSDNDIYHTNPDCPRLKNGADGVSRDAVTDRRPCQDQACEGDGPSQLQEQPCPVCGELVRKQLTFHLRGDCEGLDEGGASA